MLHYVTLCYDHEIAVEMVSQLGEKKGLTLKTSYNNVRGFYIQISTTSEK